MMQQFLVTVMGAAVLGLSLADVALARDDTSSMNAEQRLDRLERLLDSQGLWWVISHLVENFVSFRPLGLVLVALIGICVPNFVLGPLLILVFVFQFGWLPVGGWGTPAQVVLPALTLGAIRAAYIARLTRTGMLDVLQQDFVRTARAKGLRERAIVTACS